MADEDGRALSSLSPLQVKERAREVLPQILAIGGPLPAHLRLPILDENLPMVTNVSCW
jgi:hypothetical protein